MRRGHRVCLLLAVGVTVAALTGMGKPVGTADTRVPVDARHPGVLVGGSPQGAKAERDTIYVLGGPGTLTGKFQDAAGHADPQGWVGVDFSLPPVQQHWHIDTFNAALLDPDHSPNHAYWAGEVFDNACGPGYGNNYNTYLDWFGTVPNSAAATTVRLTARLNYDNEPVYDYLYLLVERSSGMDEVANWNGTNQVGGVFVPVDVDVTFSVSPDDYVGVGNDQVHLRWRAMSDGGWSDADCSWDTDGHSQVDNILVRFNGVSQGAVNTFEPGSVIDWAPPPPPTGTEFAQVWPRLTDLDPCHENTTPQWAIIADGPMPEPTMHLNVEIWSPPLDWPAGDYDGARFDYDLYTESEYPYSYFLEWHVRSSDDGGMTWSEWRDRGFVYGGTSAATSRQAETVSDLLLPGRDQVQLALGLYELGWIWGYPAGTGRAHFDNVAVLAFALEGPTITAREIDMANDAFPQSGTIDHVDLGANSVRFDMARNIAPAAHLRNDPGDSICVDVVPVRAGAVLQGMPQLHYLLRRNPLFDPYRVAGLPDEGEVAGRPTYTGSGGLYPDRYNFDLPDTGFFFPGDIVHYYFEAADNVAGDIRTSRLPVNIDGFGAFPRDSEYNQVAHWPEAFTARALPSMFSATEGDVPPILFWDDADARGGEDEWAWALVQNGFVEGDDFDIYYTKGPSSGVGNGLGGRAAAVQLAGYETLLYTCADLGAYTLANGDHTKDPSRDLQVLDAWLRQGGKNAFLTGDDLAFDLSRSGAAGTGFLATWLGLTYVANDVKPMIGGQTAPLVVPVVANPMGFTRSFLAYGGCDDLNDFDAVTPLGSALPIAAFTAPGGAPGGYLVSPMTFHRVVAYDADVVSLPLDFSFIYTPSGASEWVPTRALVLNQVLVYFGHLGSGEPAGVPELGALTVSCHPNPFNPRVEIAYTMPQTGRLTLKLYNVRGELVRVLVDGEVAAGAGKVLWDGADDGGREVASGVYFCEAKGAGKSLVSKLALVR